MLDALKSAFASKKFLATTIGAIIVALGSAFGVSETESTKIAGMITAYVLGQGLADHGMSSYGDKAEPAKEAE
jgi:hypothetical protein